VNRSADPVADVPLGVVTVTSTVPAAWAGAVAVSRPSALTVKVAATLPNCTAVAPVKPLPDTVTTVPPPVPPDVRLSPVTAGAAAAE
jgi:hypothetical protein